MIKQIAKSKLNPGRESVEFTSGHYSISWDNATDHVFLMQAGEGSVLIPGHIYRELARALYFEMKKGA